MKEETVTPEISGVCAACKARGKTWEGSDPKCAFVKGPFTGDNWNCSTANLIRELCETQDDFRIHHCREENQQYATISLLEAQILPYKDAKGYVTAQPVCLWVGWYKQRGRTEGAWLMFENKPPRQPTEAECLAVLAYYAPEPKNNI